MPPKAKYTYEEIVSAAVSITRTKGISAVTAREVGAVLGVSSRPLFTYFDSVDDLKKEVWQYAKTLYISRVEAGLAMEIPALGVGLQFLRFAKEEPELCKVLLLTPPAGIECSAMEFLHMAQDMVRDSVIRIYHMDAETADRYFRDMWLVAYSFTTLIVTGQCPFTEQEIGAMFTEFSISVCKAYKEIPGLREGNYDRDAIFREIISK